MVSPVMERRGRVVTKAKGGKSSRCWSGYEPVKGKQPYAKGSCKKSSSSPKKAGKRNG